ncbi:MAG: hypothetical protein AAB676_17130 [Verrucomicrobiota bacterium]
MRPPVLWVFSSGSRGFFTAASAEVANERNRIENRIASPSQQREGSQ